MKIDRDWETCTVSIINSDICQKEILVFFMLVIVNDLLLKLANTHKFHQKIC